MKIKLSRRNHGSVYIAVFGVSMIVLTLAIGGILATRVQSRSLDADSDISEARRTAQAGLDLARYTFNNDATWRTDYNSGTTLSGISLLNRTVSINIVDSIDGNLSNRPYDPVVITATGYKGKAAHTLTQTLVASPTPLPILQYALSSASEVHLTAAGRLVLGGAIVSSNTDVRNDNVIEGAASCLSTQGNGDYYGVLSTGVAAKTMPSGTAAAYTNLGTVISTPNTINDQVLSPGHNPYGTANADGVYVINTNSNITIQNTRIYGTLVVNCPGKNVTINGNVLFQPYRSDYPVLIVNGNLILSFTSSSSLSELITLTNFNPSGAPYQGTTDSDILDTYPSEIDGLVDVTGTVQVQSSCTLHGALICESTKSSDAVNIGGCTLTINYDSTLYTSPPQFYTSQVQMVPQAGSLTQVVN